MARHILDAVDVRNARPKAKPYRLRDGDGLFLYMPPSGVAAWQYRYKLEGKSQTLTIGKCADFTLAEARKRAEKARAVAADGGHLTTAKRVAKAKIARDEGNTFRAMADSWMRRRRDPAWSPTHREQVQASVDNHLDALYPLPVTEITAALVAPILARVERRAPLMFEKVRARLHRILDHAVTRGALERNPLPKPEPERRRNRRHFPAVTDLAGVGAILRAARATDPAKGIQRAHVLLAFTGQRVSEVVGAAWSEFDLDSGTWTIPRSRMKRKDEERGPHEIPVPPALWAQLREWRIADGERATLVCAAPRDAARSVTPEGVEKFYRDALGLQGRHSPHSWRSAFSTIARDAGKDGDVVEAQLDHVVG
ncbi:MAG: tyrosine-type recombinase/integrase, partial [Burkholderiales bacterium]|nr:tyrosine-type recombinase/integrase [Burkholderiales bacterium]